MTLARDEQNGLLLLLIRNVLEGAANELIGAHLEQLQVLRQQGPYLCAIILALELTHVLKE